jgi:transposase
VWKRCRRSLKGQRDEDQFLEGQRVLAAFHEREAAGEIDVFYLDESGLSSRSCVPYAWQRRGSTNALPSNVPGRVNVIGLTNRANEGYFHTVEGAVTHASVREAISGFIRSRQAEKLTVIVMDNASIHKKAVAAGQWDWLADWVWIWFLPAYSPELNRIEILWKKIKDEWLPWAAYHCFESLRTALQDIFENLGEKYRINYG